MIEQAGYRYASGDLEVIQPSEIILSVKRPTPQLHTSVQVQHLECRLLDHATGVESIRGEEQRSIRKAYLTVFESVDPRLLLRILTAIGEMDPQKRRKLLVILVIAEAIPRPVLAGGRHPVKHARDRTQTVIQLACADAKGAEIAGEGYLVIQGIGKLSARHISLDVRSAEVLVCHRPMVDPQPVRK